MPVRFLGPSARFLLAGALVGLGVALASVVDPGGFFEVAELKALDGHFALRGARQPASPIVIVSIDEDSFDELNLAWPWPRALHGQLLDRLSPARPAAVGLDIVFAEPSSRGPEDDEALARAIARAGNVVLGAALTAVQETGFVKEDLNPPIRPIRDGAAGYGFVNFDSDADAFVRRGSLTRSFQDRQIEGFDLLLFRLAEKAGLPSARLPRRSPVLINFRGAPRTFPTVPYHRVVSGEVPPEAFAGKIVLVGATSVIQHDVFPTPFATAGNMPGVEIHANMLETLLQGIPIRRALPGIAGTVAVLAGALAVWAAGTMRPLAAAAVVGGTLAGYLAACHAAFVLERYWADVVPVPLALALGYLGTEARNFVREQREKRRLSRFFSPDVVREIVRSQDGDDALGSARRLVTVLFSDIRGFTALSERLPPEAVVTFLREYLTVMTDAVFLYGGTVDKYIGDAIMALYNVPFEAPDHAAQAVRTGLEFQRRLGPLAAAFTAKHGGSLRCGVGINTGEAVVGTLGSEQRLEYTAIGDTINLGSRLEGVTKDFDVPIVISEATYREVKDLFDTRYLGEVTVKGKEVPVKIYTVLGEREPSGYSSGGLPATVTSASRSASK